MEQNVNKPRLGALANLVDYGDDSDSSEEEGSSMESQELEAGKVGQVGQAGPVGVVNGSSNEENDRTERAEDLCKNDAVLDELKGREDLSEGKPVKDVVVGKEVTGIAEDSSSVLKGTNEVEEEKPDVEMYRERRISTASSSSDDDSDIGFSSSGSSDSDSDGESGSDRPGEQTTTKQPVKKKKPVPHVKGELFLEDLPPIVDLQISVPENKVELIGKVVNVVGCLVTVESFENKPALDLNTVLFTEEGRKAIGHIFEVFGRTSQPYYCVRFNSPEHAKSRGVEPGTLIYAAPGTEHTRYVFLAQLERLRGTDASWKDDHEAPSEVLEFSDDETEKVIKNRKRRPRVRNQPVNRSFPPEANGPQETPEDVRLFRKRNFNNNPGFPGSAQGNRFGSPRHPGFSPGPFRPTFNQRCFRPMVPDFPNSHDFYGAPRYGPIDPYGNHRFGPPPNPFSVGGAAVGYRPPYENPPNNWMNYPRNQNPGYYQLPPHAFGYDYQAAWASYQHQSNLPSFTSAQPPPPPPQPIVGAPVLNKDAIKTAVKTAD